MISPLSLCRLLVLSTSLLVALPSLLQAQVNAAFHSRPTHTWWTSSASLENLPIVPTLGTQGDFNQDGFEDILVGDLSEIFVAQNNTWGLSAWESVPLETGGIKSVVWDKEEKTLWIQRTSPDRVEVRRWKNNQFVLEHAFQGSPEKLNLSSGTGMLSLKRQGLELELLRTDGTVEVLVKDASELSNAWLWNDARSESQALVLQDKAEGKLGIVRAADRGWEPPQWWEDTQLTAQWMVDETRVEEEGVHLHILGADHQSFWYKSVDPFSGDVVRKCQFGGLGEVRLYAPRYSGSRIELIVHNPMTYVVRVVELNTQSCSGEVIFVEEMDQLPFVLDFDLKSDGTTDWMYPVSGKPYWTLLTEWSELSQRWVWRSLDHFTERDDFNLLGQDWTEGLSSLEEVSEVWMHRGALHARTPQSWWTVEETEPPVANAPPDLDPPSGSPHSLQLVLPYLELGDHGTGTFIPGIAEIKPHVWHHLAFSRDEDNDTKVWLDGKLVFLGRSKKLNYLYNSLLVGASFGHEWRNHGSVSVDRAVLSGSTWTDEEVRLMSKGEGDLNPGQYAERWEFDDPSFTSERRKRAMLLHSEPKLDVGLYGGCVTMDGTDDALRTFLAVPKKGISISFFFRLNEEKITRPHTVASLYGMYNTWFNVVWQPKSFLAQPHSIPGVITTPNGCRVSPSVWPKNCDPFLYEGGLFLLDSNNVILAEGPLGWQPAVQPPRELQGRTGHPWIANKAMHLLDSEQNLWTWSREKPWRCEGRISVSQGVIPVAAEEGMLALLDSTWTWWLDPTLPGKQSEAAAGNVEGMIQSPAGEVLRLAGGQSRFLSSAHPFSGPETPPLVSTSNANRRTVLLACLALGALLLGAVRLRKRIGTSIQVQAGIPVELRGPLTRWVARKGVALDTMELDTLLSYSAHESEETRRGRRSRFIREMNAWGKLTVQEDFVLRERDSYDRRRAVYVLHPRVIEIFEDAREG